MEQSFKKCCVISALDGTEDGILWDNYDLDCLFIKSDLQEYVDS
jgi:hypothetical protein